MGKRKSGIRQKTERVAGLFLSLFLVGFLTTGCAGLLPYPDSPEVRGQAVPGKSIIIPGKTTKNEILTSFGPPKTIWEEENVLIYFWEESEPPSWLDDLIFPPKKKCRQQVFFSTKWETCETIRKERVWKKKMCFLLFDQKDILKNFKIQDRPYTVDEVGAELEAWFVNEIDQQLPTSWTKLKAATLILRIVTTNDGIQIKNRHRNWTQAIGIELGKSRTAGSLFWHKKPEVIGTNFKEDGWVIFKVEPGYRYIHFYLARPWKADARSSGRLRTPIFQIDVPFNDAFFYAGSFHFDRKLLKKTLFWSSWENRQFAGIIDERELAQQVATYLFPENSTLETSLAVAHEDPRILTTPSNLPPQPSK